MAVDDANLEIDDELSNHTGILIGSSLGNFAQTTDYFHDIIREGPSEVSPMKSYDVALNSSVNYVSVFFKMKSFARTISSGFTSGTDAIGNAVKLIQNGKAKVIIAGGVEQISLDLYMIFYLQKMLATGNEISMPFDKRRDGFIMSEGSYIFVREEAEHAQSRGAKIYGEISGYGSLFSGNRKSDIEKRVEKACNAMKLCIDDAGTSQDNIDLISANGNSGKLSDLIEANAVKELFGEKSEEIPVHAIKSTLGESYGASGAAQTASALLSINNGLVPPTINYDEKDPECNLNIVNEKHERNTNTVLINSFDLSGNNSCLIIKKHE
jgi:3-oxoacyl-[acyl-carrier-protein] synthase II